MQSKVQIFPFTGNKLIPNELPNLRLLMGPKTVSSLTIVRLFFEDAKIAIKGICRKENKLYLCGLK
jgi:hypothetical protein